MSELNILQQYNIDESNWNDFHNFNAVIEDINITSPGDEWEDVSVYFDMRCIKDNPMDGIRFMLLYALNTYVAAIEGEWIVSLDFETPDGRTMISVNDWQTNQEPIAYQRILDIMDRNI